VKHRVYASATTTTTRFIHSCIAGGTASAGVIERVSTRNSISRSTSSSTFHKTTVVTAYWRSVAHTGVGGPWHIRSWLMTMVRKGVENAGPDIAVSDNDAPNFSHYRHTEIVLVGAAETFYSNCSEKSSWLLELQKTSSAFADTSRAPLRELTALPLLLMMKASLTLLRTLFCLGRLGLNFFGFFF